MSFIFLHGDMSTLLYCYDMICTTHSLSEVRVQNHSCTDSGTSTVSEIDSQGMCIHIYEVFPDATATRSYNICMYITYVEGVLGCNGTFQFKKMFVL
jgi:hypothetical protein